MQRNLFCLDNMFKIPRKCLFIHLHFDISEPIVQVAHLLIEDAINDEVQMQRQNVSIRYLKLCSNSANTVGFFSRFFDRKGILYGMVYPMDLNHLLALVNALDHHVKQHDPFAKFDLFGELIAESQLMHMHVSYFVKRVTSSFQILHVR